MVDVDRQWNWRPFMLGALASCLALALLLGLSGCRRSSGRPNILLITLDTTRIDHLGCYGYDRRTSPNLDALAAESVLYKRAMATSSWTLPSHASLFTGKLTSSHGARYDPEGPLRLKDAIAGPDSWDRYRARGLSPQEETLAGILRRAGYATGAVVAGPWMKQIFGLGRGFDFYDDEEIGTINGRPARSVTRSAVEWIEKNSEAEFFLFLNYYDPHGPMAPPPELARQFLPPGTELDSGEPLTREQYLALYDAEILSMDKSIGDLLTWMKAASVYENTWIIVTADHGELFGEHGEYGHGHHLFQEEIHVPLIMKFPDGEAMPGVREDLVSVTDVLPWICTRLDLEIPEGIQGGSLRNPERPVIAETYPLPSPTSDGSWRAMFEGDHKLLWNSKTPARLFDLARDPREQNDLAAVEPERVTAMLTSLNEYLEGLPGPASAGPEAEVDEETRRALESLGYVD